MSRLDRTGEPIDPENPSDTHRPGTDCAPGGWLWGHTLNDDEPKPCLHCRPHLKPDVLHRGMYGPADPGPAQSPQERAK
jgi:hypothetical protein